MTQMQVLLDLTFLISGTRGSQKYKQQTMAEEDRVGNTIKLLILGAVLKVAV